MSVKIYSTSNCPYCVMAKEFFKKSNVKYEDIDVGNDEGAAKEMVKKSGQMGVPVIDINGKIIVGFDKPKIMEALKKGRK